MFPELEEQAGHRVRGAVGRLRRGIVDQAGEVEGNIAPVLDFDVAAYPRCGGLRFLVRVLAALIVGDQEFRAAMGALAGPALQAGSTRELVAVRAKKNNLLLSGRSVFLAERRQGNRAGSQPRFASLGGWLVKFRPNGGIGGGGSRRRRSRHAKRYPALGTLPRSAGPILGAAQTVTVRAAKFNSHKRGDNNGKRRANYHRRQSAQACSFSILTYRSAGYNVGVPRGRDRRFSAISPHSPAGRISQTAACPKHSSTSTRTRWGAAPLRARSCSTSLRAR